MVFAKWHVVNSTGAFFLSKKILGGRKRKIAYRRGQITFRAYFGSTKLLQVERCGSDQLAPKICAVHGTIQSSP